MQFVGIVLCLEGFWHKKAISGNIALNLPQVDAMDGIIQWGLEIVRQVQALGPAFETPMRLFTFLGQEEFFLVLMPLILWCLDKSVGANMGVVLILSAYFNGLFKGIFHLPRPYWLDASLGKAAESSFGVPSGHAQNTVTIWGYLAHRLHKAWAWGMALAVIVLVSLSRLYLGVHFPFDVLGGWIIGGALLAAYIAFQPRLTAWLKMQDLKTHFALSALASALALGLYALGSILFKPGQPAYDTELFSAGLEEARNGAFTTAGMILGGGVGLALEAHYVRFKVSGPLWKRAARYVLGVLVLFGLWYGLKAVFPAEPAMVGLPLRFLRYTMMILWAVGLWPWLFTRFGLAERDQVTIQN